MLMSRKERIVAYEQQAKFMQERIIFTERNFGELCNVFAEYTRKIGKIRDKSDDVAKIVINYAETEHVNKSLSDGLANFAYCFSILGDYADLRVQKLENNINELSPYETICKTAKEDIKHIFNVRDREIARKRQLDRIRERNPRNRQQITQAETELLKATAEVSRTIHSLEEQTNEFEKRKLHDLKNVLLKFVTIEMAFHAKALETLSKTYQEIVNIDEEQDLQEFQKNLRTPDTVPHLSHQKPKRNIFKSTQSLSDSISATPTKQRPSFALKRPSSTGHLSKSNDTLSSVNTDQIASVDSIESESDDHSLNIANRFIARTHRHTKK